MILVKLSPSMLMLSHSIFNYSQWVLRIRNCAILYRISRNSNRLAILYFQFMFKTMWFYVSYLLGYKKDSYLSEWIVSLVSTMNNKRIKWINYNGITISIFVPYWISLCKLNCDCIYNNVTWRPRETICFHIIDQVSGIFQSHHKRENYFRNIHVL